MTVLHSRSIPPPPTSPFSKAILGDSLVHLLFHSKSTLKGRVIDVAAIEVCMRRSQECAALPRAGSNRDGIRAAFQGAEFVRLHSPHARRCDRSDARLGRLLPPPARSRRV